MVHVRDRGLNSKDDSTVLDKAFEEDRVVVTSNISDFERLARARECHAGLVLVEEGDLKRDEQIALLRRVLSLIEAERAAGRDMVNRAMRIGRNFGPIFETIPPIT